MAERSQAGDREAFSLLVERHTDRLFSFLLHWVPNAEDAEDLAQETFLRAYRSIHRFNPRRPFLPWLFAIARRAAASHWRRTRFHEAGTQCPNEAVTTDNPVECLASAEDASALWHEARRLRPKQFRALWLFYGEEFAVADVARVMGTSSIHVKVLLHRGRTALARRLGETKVGREIRDRLGKRSRGG